MLIVGITGGIASGKTTVTNILKKYKQIIVDLDDINRAFLFNDEDILKAIEDVYPLVVERFSYSEVQEDFYRRPKMDMLASLAFTDPDCMSLLEKLLTNPVHLKVRQELLALEKKGEKLVFYSNPLMFKGEWSLCDMIFECKCEPQTQLARLMDRSKICEEEAKRRIKVQAKANKANVPLLQKQSVKINEINTEISKEDLEVRLTAYLVGTRKKL